MRPLSGEPEVKALAHSKNERGLFVLRCNFVFRCKIGSSAPHAFFCGTIMARIRSKPAVPKFPTEAITDEIQNEVLVARSFRTWSTPDDLHTLSRSICRCS